MDVDHSFIAQMFKEEVQNLLRNIEEKQPSNKKTNPFKGQFLFFFLIKNAFKKEDVP